MSLSDITSAERLSPLFVPLFRCAGGGGYKVRVRTVNRWGKIWVFPSHKLQTETV